MAVSHPDATPLISNYVVHHARGRDPFPLALRYLR